MATAAQFPGDVLVLGNLQYTGSLLPGVARSGLTQDTSQSYWLPWDGFRVWDAVATNLPATPASDDLGLIGGTWGTGVPSIQTGDLKAAGSTTRYARCQFQLPPEYVTGTGIVLRLHAGMITTIAGTAATVDVEVYKSGKEFLVSGSDLCATAATSINIAVKVAPAIPARSWDAQRRPGVVYRFIPASGAKHISRHAMRLGVIAQAGVAPLGIDWI